MPLQLPYLKLPFIFMHSCSHCHCYCHCPLICPGWCYCPGPCPSWGCCQCLYNGCTGVTPQTSFAIALYTWPGDFSCWVYLCSCPCPCPCLAGQPLSLRGHLGVSAHACLLMLMHLPFAGSWDGYTCSHEQRYENYRTANTHYPRKSNMGVNPPGPPPGGPAPPGQRLLRS